ncbi:hypothetical protein BBP40_011178 [Aspergillus hancockii]|nr:hypothetical protein BBP40_011178 [Aspergillus hancockii]
MRRNLRAGGSGPRDSGAESNSIIRAVNSSSAGQPSVRLAQGSCRRGHYRLRGLNDSSADIARPEARAQNCPGRSSLLCSGGKGRNGGHIQTMTFAMWEERKQIFGIEEAICISEFEISHLPAMAEAIHQDGLAAQCDLQLTEGIEAYYNPTSFEKVLEALRDMRVHMPRLAQEHCVYTGAELARPQQALNLSPPCIGAIGDPAATLWPYKWITGVLDSFIESGKLHIQTQTTARRVLESDGDFAIVRTNRGDIQAKHVVHATNAWLSHLLPELQPQLSEGSENVSPLGFSHRFSYWLRYDDKDYDYLTQRKGGDIVVGRANTSRKATADDSETDLAPMAPLLSGLEDEVAASPVAGSSAYITHAWSGILAFSQDDMPFAGRLLNRTHQWVCGGYHATGMAKVFHTAQLVAGLTAGGTV